MRTYLIRLNGCPWFEITIRPGHHHPHEVAYAVARGEHPQGVAVTWL
jgi:hypothetical protein